MQNIFEHCESIYLDYLNLKNCKPSNDLKLIEAAKFFKGFPIVSINEEQEEVKGILVFIIVEGDISKARVLSEALKDNTLNLEEDFQDLQDLELIQLFPETLDGDDIFEIKKSLNESLSFDFVDNKELKKVEDEFTTALKSIKLEKNPVLAKKKIEDFKDKYSLFGDIAELLDSIAIPPPNLKIV